MPKAATKRKSATSLLEAFDRTLDKALAVVAKDPEALEGMHARQGNPITLGPRVAEAADWAGKQVTNAAAAAERWLANVQRPKKNPILAAKAANQKYKNAVAEAIRQDKFAKGLDQVDEDEMYATIAEGGSTPFSSGVNRRARKVARVVADLRPRVVALAETLDKMPVDTAEQREAKMIAAKRGMEKIGKQRRGITT